MASFSSICRLDGCKRKALLSLVCNRFKPKGEALAFGTAFHASLEKGLEAGINELRKEHLQDQIPLLTEMYVRQETFMAKNNIEVLAHELDFEIKLDGLDEPFRGFIDGLALWNGEQWLLEFKTARYIDVSHVPIDSQITAYLWACRETGLAEPKGVIYIVNQKSMNKPPVVLANGHLSTAKNQGCSYQDYVDKAMEIYGEDVPAKVELFMEWLEKNEQPKLVAVPTKRTEKQLNRFGDDIRRYVEMEQELKRLLEEKGATKAIRETPCFPSKFCFQNCDFKDQCKAILLDDSIEFDRLDKGMYDDIFNAN